MYKYKRQMFKVGSYFYFGFSIFAIFLMRFLLEYTKENQESFEDSMFFNMGQLLSIPFIVLGLYLVLRGYIQSSKMTTKTTKVTDKQCRK